jgi:hypothetical protein
MVCEVTALAHPDPSWGWIESYFEIRLKIEFYFEVLLSLFSSSCNAYYITLTSLEFIRVVKLKIIQIKSVHFKDSDSEKHKACKTLALTSYN